MKTSGNILTFIAAAATAVIATACAAGRSGSTSANAGMDAAKADYVYLEATRLNTTDQRDSYFELVRHARELSPDDKYLGFLYGYNNLMAGQGDSAATAEGYALMGDYADSAPEDFYNNVLYASIGSRIGEKDNAVRVWRRLHNANPERPEVGVRYAEALAQRGDSADIITALAVYDSLETSMGHNLQLTSRKIQLHYLVDDTAAMLREALDLLATSPNMPEYNIFAGDMFMQLGNRDSALRFYDRAVELDPDDGVAYYSRAAYYRATGDSVGYDREIFKALQMENLDLQPKIEILRDYTAGLYTDSLQRPRIEAMYQRLLQLHPHEAAVHNLYRDYLLAVEDYPGAAEQTQLSLDIDPSDPDKWTLLTTLLVRTENYDGALGAAIRGEHFHPDNAVLYLLAGSVLTQLGDNDRSIEQLRSGLSLADSTDYALQSDIISAIGDNLYALGLNDSAFTYYDHAITLNPDNMTALNNCAYYLACTDREIDKAEELILRVVAERPDEATSLDTYAWVLFKKKDYEQALRVIDDALAKSPEPSAELYDHSGDIAFMNRLFDRAMDDWRKALALDPENGKIARKIKLKHLLPDE